MVDGYPQAIQCVQMHLGAVTHVAFKAITGEGASNPHHQVIPGNLGHNRGRSNGKRAAVALDDMFTRTWGERGDISPVKQRMAWRNRQAVEGTRHGPKGCAPNVEGINLGRRG